ncbi:MAG: AAA family ATPase [Acutalibacteraceae bacterium]|nr:AAA family ATPase [Acutalibacteraceae bacterium]
MKIKSVNIAAFGGLKNKVIDFSDGFNVVYGDNENGKTTVMSFIKMMFYGSGRASAQIAKNARKKYMPWDGSAMAGSIDFELKGKNYRLEREFRSSDSTDKVALCDLDLGTREAVSPDIGVKLLGLTSAAFERSVFIGQMGFPEKDAAAEGEINSKLSNIVTTGDESVSFNTVSARLEKAKTSLMSKSGRAGEYDKNIKRIEGLLKRAEESEKIRADYADFTERAKDYKADMEKDIKKAAELKAKIDSEQDIRNAEKLREMLKTKEELDTLNESLKLEGGGLADDAYVKMVDLSLSMTETAEKSFNDKTAEALRLRESLSTAVKPPDSSSAQQEALKEREELEGKSEQIKAEILKNEEEINKLSSIEAEVLKSRKGVKIPLIAVGAVLLATAAVVFAVFSSAVFSVASAAVGLILLVLGFVLRPLDREKIDKFYSDLNKIKAENENLKREREEVFQKITLLSARLEAINTAINAGVSVTERQRALLSECEEQARGFKTEFDTKRDALLKLFGRYKRAESIEQIKAELEALTANAAKQKEIKQRLNYIVRDLGNITYEEAERRIETLPDYKPDNTDFEALKQEYDALLALITQKRERLAASEAKALSRLEAAENPDELRSEIEGLKKKTALQAQFVKAADIALEVLKDSFAELRRGYGSALEQKAGEIFGGITGGKYESMQISKSFDITVEKSGVFGGKESAFLSAGTYDQAYLSLRLALSDLIFENAESLPILLDDALTQYDDKRAETALKYLKEYSKDGQIIMFTCHRAIYSSAEKSGAECKEF